MSGNIFDLSKNFLDKSGNIFDKSGNFPDKRKNRITLVFAVFENQKLPESEDSCYSGIDSLSGYDFFAGNLTDFFGKMKIIFFPKIM